MPARTVSEGQKHPDFIYYEKNPLNGAPPPGLLRGGFITPFELFYVRCHGEIPELDAADYRLKIGGLVERPLELSLEALQRDFVPHHVGATLQCAGNRREELIRVKDIPGEAPWSGGAISHAVWTGARLADVLAAAGVDRAAAKHVEFIGHDTSEKEGKPPFGGSVPISKALAPETLLVYAMDGQPLPVLHGFPVRALAPGYLGARSVKWLREINVLAQPSDNHFQAVEYRLYPATASKEDHDPADAFALGEMAVTSYICRVRRGGPGGSPTVVEGYAFAGGANEIARVEVSTDDGAHWTRAALLPPGTADPAEGGGGAVDEEGGRWGWRLWRAELNPGEVAPVQIVCRAFDTAANTQPGRPADVWNFKGYANNAWHRVISTPGSGGRAG